MAGGRRGSSSRSRKFDLSGPSVPVTWEPKTKLGKLVKSGQIATMTDVLKSGLPLREP